MNSISVTVKRAKRLVIFIIGSSILLLGVAMIILPGPAIVFIPIGLAILGTEFIWARRLLRGFTNKSKSIRSTVMDKMNGKNDENAKSDTKRNRSKG